MNKILGAAAELSPQEKTNVSTPIWTKVCTGESYKYNNTQNTILVKVQSLIRDKKKTNQSCIKVQ